MFCKTKCSKFDLKENFFLPLECENSLRDIQTSKKKCSVAASTGFFPLDDTSSTSQERSINHTSNHLYYNSFETVASYDFTCYLPTKSKVDSKQQDSSSDSTSSKSKKFNSSENHRISESLRSNRTSFVLSLADEDVMEFDFNDKTPCCVDLLSGATLEKSALTLNELNKKLFDVLHELGASKDNPEKNLIELILPNCLTLSTIFDESELMADNFDDIFENSTFINTIEFIVHDIWVDTLTRNLSLVQMFENHLEYYKDAYIVCKLNGPCPSTNILEILENLKYFPSSVLETFRFGIRLKGQDRYPEESTIMNYIVFIRTFCTIVLEIQKCFILIIKFMHSANLLNKLSNQVFLSFIDILAKIVFHCQIPQLFLGINDVVELWLQDEDMERRQQLRAWCDATIHDMNQAKARGDSREGSNSITSSTDGGDSLEFNKWDVIEPFIESIKTLQRIKIRQDSIATKSPHT